MEHHDVVAIERLEAAKENLDDVGLGDAAAQLVHQGGRRQGYVCLLGAAPGNRAGRHCFELAGF
jgi:hypothetical protein